MLTTDGMTLVTKARRSRLTASRVATVARIDAGRRGQRILFRRSPGEEVEPAML